MTMQFEDLDMYCRKILMVLIRENSEIGFNQLFDKVKKHGRVSKPTFISHLKELEDKKYIINRRDEKSNSPWKPSYYILNYDFIKEFVKMLKPDYEKNEWFKALSDLNKRLDKLDFKQLSRELVGCLYIGDLYITKFFLESLRKQEEKFQLEVVRNIFVVALDLIQIRLLDLSKKMKDAEITEMIKEIDETIEKIELSMRQPK